MVRLLLLLLLRLAAPLIHCSVCVCVCVVYACVRGFYARLDILKIRRACCEAGARALARLLARPVYAASQVTLMSAAHRAGGGRSKGMRTPRVLFDVVPTVSTTFFLSYMFA